MNGHPALLNQRLAAALQTGEDAPALVAAGTVISYRQLMVQVAATAARLRTAETGKGDRVAFQLPNCADAVVLMLAALMTGAVPVPMLPAYRERELRHVLKATRPRVIALTKGNRRFSAARVVTDFLRDENLDVALRLLDGSPGDEHAGWRDLGLFCSAPSDATAFSECAAAEMLAEDTAMMLLSSGTTGLPKAIARLNGGYSYMIAKACRVFELSRQSVYLAAMPISHGFVINCPGMLGTLICGGTVVLASDTSVQTALELVSAHGVTHTTLVPALLTQWLEQSDDLPARPGTLQHVQVGGSRLSPDLAARAESKLGIRIQQCYGMSEGLLCFTRSTDTDAVRFHSQGRPLSEQDQVLIVDESGTPVPCGASGELITRGPYTIKTYYNDPLASSRAFTPDGYYRTGDLAHLDADGNVYIDGRVTDSINRGGEKFSPEELEELSKGHARLKDAACVGMADPRFGEVACLFAVAHEGEPLLLSDIRQYLETAGVASFKLPEKLVLVDEIPRKGIGKIDRALLRARVRDDAEGAGQASKAALL
ncbi:AMP-binding protein [Burkholderia humptydooensis]|uniref:AMP-binding protein n=2 Tax=Burkholderia humptydooensis TaxID=430531 RepID=A0A7U4SVW2_9BURK|nr:MULTISPECIES: AMP-binding protein [Burkholderia]AJY39560.1 AMP-binding enzyme family protein [Burkholderia sp. 2002721687]ALX46358.1 siderophore biosynthesis protein [Burkholderia humptydooensis]EIP85784.1 putative siderophore biosynthesis enzyme [Burkholderia humptydooensis MSMB43]QPS47867.1 AMP-binding protein [Burkholderia humptydooensis]